MLERSLTQWTEYLLIPFQAAHDPAWCLQWPWTLSNNWPWTQQAQTKNDLTVLSCVVKIRCAVHYCPQSFSSKVHLFSSCFCLGWDGRRQYLTVPRLITLDRSWGLIRGPRDQMSIGQMQDTLTPLVFIYPPPNALFIIWWLIYIFWIGHTPQKFSGP